MSNPKAIVFFLALFPGFLSAAHPVAPQSLIYGAIFVSLDAAFILGYALLAMHLLRSPRAAWLDIDRISAIGFCAIGLLLIAKGWQALPAPGLALS